MAAVVSGCTPYPHVESLEFDEDLPTLGPLPIDPIPDDAYIHMRRTGCFGECPQYEVRIRADGSMQWSGDMYVAAEGGRTSTFERAAFVELWRSLAVVPWHELPATEPSFGSDMCHRRATDMPTVHVRVGAGGFAYRVHDYQGCDGNDALKDFRTIEDRIDALAGTARWIHGAAAQ